MEQKEPLVSIIVRTKDRPKLLKNAIKSIAEQTYRQIEVVLVNDGGCDLNVEELKNTLGDMPLNYIRLAKNTGRAHAGNAGIANAKGDYIGFLDDDDEYYPEHISTLVNFLEQADYKIAYTDAEMIYRNFVPEEHNAAAVSKTILFSKIFSYEELLVGNYIPFMCPLFSKEVLEGFDESFDLYEDWDLLIRISQKYPFHHIKKVTAQYNQWSKELQINQSNKEQMKAIHLKVISKHRDKITPEIIFNMKNKIEMLMLRFEEFDNNYKALEMKLLDDSAYFSNIEESIRWKNSHIIELEGVAIEKESHILQLQDVVREKDSLILQMQKNMEGLELALYLMRNTIGWKLLEKFRIVRDKMIISGTTRRKMYDLIIKSFQTIKNEGMVVFLKKCKIKMKARFLGSKISTNISNIKISRHSLSPDKFRVLFLISPWAGVTNRYRAYNMKEYLGLMGTESEVVGIEELDTQPDYALGFDIIVIHRIPMNEILNALIEKCKELRIPVIFDLDDYLFDVALTDRIDEIKRMSPIDRNKWIQHVRGCRDTLDACDYFIGTTDYIVKKVRELGKKAFVIRNGLNKTQVAQSGKALIKIKRDPDIVKIGYFSGTKTHQKDFEVVIAPLLKIMEEYKNVHLCIGGFLELHSSFEKFSERIERLPYVDWKELPFNLAAIDINIAPLEENNPFCEAKSELKYFESALLKVPSVCTPTDTYKWAIKNGENGMLASTEEDWYTCLKSLIVDPSLRKALGEKAYKMVMGTYTPNTQAQKTIEVYKSIIMDYKETRNC
ncbi:MAG: glycosyltransferase [Nitrospirota bacterium]